MRNVPQKILYFITHPLLILMYFVVSLFFTHDFLFLPTETFIGVGKSLFLSQIAMPFFIFFTTSILQKHLPDIKGNMLIVASFTTYFVIVTVFAHTAFAPISIMQQLPLTILIAAVILERHGLLQMRVLCLSALAISLIFISLLFATNLTAIIITNILASGCVSFFVLENGESSVKKLSINLLTGTILPIIFFLFIAR